MDKQKKITDENLIKTCGFIRSLQINQREGKDPTYKFQLRYLDKTDNLIEPDDWYSGFKYPPGVDGDYIVFNYKINGIYKNVKDVLDIKITHEEPIEKDKENLEEIKTPTKFDTPYYATLLVSTINLCIKKGTMSDDEIKAQYNIFLKLVAQDE